MNALEEKLVELLHSIAMYNDKGYIWYRHSHAESEMMCIKWRQEVNDLIAQIGRSQFLSDLLNELDKSDVVQDGSGVYAERVSAWFSRNNQQ